MNNSINFVLNKIKDKEVHKNFEKDNWNQATIINPMEFLRPFIKNNNIDSIFYEVENIDETINKTIRRNITINYSPDGNYDYFISDSCIYDGTLLFVNQLINNILESILTGKSYNKKDVPVDFLKEYWKYDIIYNIGDILLNTIDGDFDLQKPFLQTKTLLLYLSD